MGLKKGIKILKSGVERRLEFIEWLKSNDLFNPMDSAATMQKMHEVREITLDQVAKNGPLYEVKLLFIGMIVGGFLHQLFIWLQIG